MCGKYFSIPTWLLANVMSPLYPKDHPWKGRYFTLRDWHDHATDVTQMYNLIFWCLGVSLFLLLRLL